MSQEKRPKTPKNVTVRTTYIPDRVRQVRALLRVLGEDDSGVTLESITEESTDARREGGSDTEAAPDA
jgi:hypothetical protein